MYLQSDKLVSPANVVTGTVGISLSVIVNLLHFTAAEGKVETLMSQKLFSLLKFLQTNNIYLLNCDLIQLL